MKVKLNDTIDICILKSGTIALGRTNPSTGMRKELLCGSLDESQTVTEDALTELGRELMDEYADFCKEAAK